MDEKQISELLECSVCLERFDQSCKVLPCQHTFCRQCLDEIMLTKHELRCPECRALVTVRVSELPTNILVVRILEGLKTKGHNAGSSVRQHGPTSLGSSPSKGGASGQLPMQDPTSNHLLRQGTQPCAKALFNYESSEKNDLSFKKGDMILLRRKIDDNWYQGEIGGRSGFFPSNFVQILVPLPQIPQCISLYNFDLQDEGEKDCLSFKKDEILTVIRRVDENWLEGRKGDKIGIFPITFVKLNEAARSLINTKSNLTILPGMSPSYNTPITSSGTTITSGTSSSTALVRTTTTSSTTTTNTIADVPATDLVSGDDLETVLPLLQHVSTEPFSEAVAEPTTESLPESVTTSRSTPPVTSVPTATTDVPPQNKRHSFTSSSSSSPLIPAVSSDHTPQRHSAEVTLTEEGALALVSSEITTCMSLSSISLPSSVMMDAQPSTTASPRNTLSSPSTTSEVNTEVSASGSSSGGVQSGSLTTPLYIALFNYKPRKDDELELYKGEHYTVVDKCQDGWYRGFCVCTGQSGVFPGNYVQLLRHSSAFKPINPTLLTARPKVTLLPSASTSTVHSTATSDHQPTHTSGETTSQAPPLMPRVAKMSTLGQKSRSPLSHLAGTPLRSLSNPGASTTSSPQHAFSHSSSLPSSQIPSHIGLSRPLIPAPPPSTTSSHHSLWVPPSLAAMQHSMSASSSITPPNVVMNHSLDAPPAAVASAVKDKKEKKEKVKKGLVKLLSGKSKKSKQASVDPEPAPPLAVVCFDSGIHFRSGSHPVNGTAVSNFGAGSDFSVISAHRKASSFDATTVPPIPTKPRPKVVTRERYCCIIPYPPQTEHELCLELGDIIHVHRKREDGWYKGTQERTGKTGMFPASFVERCD